MTLAAPPGPGSGDANIRIDRRGDGASLLAVFGELARDNAAAVTRRARLGWWAAGALATLVFGTPVVFVAASVVATLLADSMGDTGALVAVLFVVGATGLTAVLSLVLFIWMLVRRGRIAAQRLDAAKVSIAEALIGALAADLAPGSALHLYLDLVALERTPPVAVHGLGRRYRQHWLRLEARLVDGASLRIDALLQLKKKSQPKRRYTKYREQIVDRLMIRLSTRGGSALPPDAVSRIQRRFAYSSLVLVRARCEGNAAMLQLASYPCLRQRTRAGFSQQGAERRLDAAKAVGATLRAYRAVTAARAGY